MTPTQTYQNHTRWFPLFHFVTAPILLFNLIWQSVMLYREPSWDWNRAEMVVLAIGLITLSLASRLQSISPQDRIIRLEEKLRYKDVLSSELAEQSSNLKMSQVIALRFASDEELAELVQKTLNGELADAKAIKLAIKNWRGDYARC